MAQTYPPIPLSDDETLGWVSLGTGPLWIQQTGEPQQERDLFIALFFGSAAPSATDLGFSVKLTMDGPTKILSTLGVWALCSEPNVSLLVMPGT